MKNTSGIQPRSLTTKKVYTDMNRTRPTSKDSLALCCFSYLMFTLLIAFDWFLVLMFPSNQMTKQISPT